MHIETGCAGAWGSTGAFSMPCHCPRWGQQPECHEIELLNHYCGRKILIDQLQFSIKVTGNVIAVAWILLHPAGIQTIVGSTSRKRIQGICRASDVRLTREGGMLCIWLPENSFHKHRQSEMTNFGPLFP